MKQKDPRLVELNDRVQRAIYIAYRYGTIDGSHHKMWVIDQMVRLLVDNYDEWTQDGAWDIGIAP